VTRSGWLAIGVAFAALVGPALGAAATVLLGLSAVVAVSSASMAGVPLARRRMLRRWLPLALGIFGLGLRLLLGSSEAPTTPLPEGRGPWTATVQTRSSNRDGAQIATLQVAGADARGWIVAATLPRYPDVEPGHIVTVDGSIQPPPDGPYGDYLDRIGVVGTVRSRSLAIVGIGAGPGPLLEQLRRAAGDALAVAIPEPEAGLAAGIVIGLRDRVDRELAAEFTTVGASHVVAISGWNIAIVAATVAALAGAMGRRRRALILVVAIVVYVVFAGASPSVVRAGAMAGVVLFARESGRAGRASAALGWAAALLLLVEPGLILDAGFQLSTLATAGILAWADRLDRRLGSLFGGRLPRWLAESLGVSLAAQAATLPIVLLSFGRLALIAPVINLAIVPLVAPAMAVALVALLGGVLALAGGPSLVATLAGLPAWALLTMMSTIVRAGAALPFAGVTLEPPWGAVTAALSLAAPLGIVAVRRHRRAAKPAVHRPSGIVAHVAGPAARSPALAVSAATPRSKPGSRRGPRLVVVGLAVALGSLSLAAAHRSDGVARITVLDVGQGDAILVEGGAGGRLLVDGGPDPDRLLVELDRRLPPWDRRLDILVLTHPHEDHVAGLPLLLERYRIGQVFETGMRGPGPGYAAFTRELAGPDAPQHRVLSRGGRIALDDIRLDVLWPDPGGVPREPPNGGRAINDVSIVLLGEVAGRRFLLTGDVEDDVDPIIAARGIPSVDVLKVAHHGSGTASTDQFLAAVRPRIAIVSSGADNPYGHPARTTIERLRASGAQVLRTDTDGSVTLAIDPAGAMRISTTGPRAAQAPARVRAGLATIDVLGSRIDQNRKVDAASTAAVLPSVDLRDRISRRGPALTCGIPSSA
jgi:competence protein ComEC